MTAAGCSQEIPPWIPEPQLGKDSLHIWSVPLDLNDLSIEACRRYLSEDERQRADCFVRARDRDRFTVAHAGLRLLLARYTDARPGMLRLVGEPNEKPTLEGGKSAISFNLSHSSDLAVIALARHGRVGVDVEQIRFVEDAAGIGRLVFTQMERAAIAAAPAPERDRAFLTCWTRKEAFVKAIGQGLSFDLFSFDVNLSREHPGFMRISEAVDAAERWSIVHLEPAAGYLGAAVTDAVVTDMHGRLLDLTVLSDRMY